MVIIYGPCHIASKNCQVQQSQCDCLLSITVDVPTNTHSMMNTKPFILWDIISDHFQLTQIYIPQFHINKKVIQLYMYIPTVILRLSSIYFPRK